MPIKQLNKYDAEITYDCCGKTAVVSRALVSTYRNKTFLQCKSCASLGNNKGAGNKGRITIIDSNGASIDINTIHEEYFEM